MEDCIKQINNIRLPDINYDENLLESDNFKNYKISVTIVLNHVNHFLDQLGETFVGSDGSSLQEFIVRIIILCGEHSGSFLWTNKETVSLSEDIVRKICLILKCNHEELFAKVAVPNGDKKIGLLLLSTLRPKLLKESWKMYPASVMCYKWIIEHIKIPYMYEFIYSVFPTTLNILDDYTTQNKIIGLQCLKHILQNLTPNQLEQYCSASLIYDTVKVLLYWREVDLVIPLIECILQIQEISHTANWKKCADLKWSKYQDETLDILLPIVEFEQNIELQMKYIEALYIILVFPKTTFAIARWSEKLISIIDTYAMSSVTELLAMKVLYQYLLKCHPVILVNGRKMALIAGKVIHRSSNENTVFIASKCYTILYRSLSSSIKLPCIEDIKNHSKFK